MVQTMDQFWGAAAEVSGAAAEVSGAAAGVSGAAAGVWEAAAGVWEAAGGCLGGRRGVSGRVRRAVQDGAEGGGHASLIYIVVKRGFYPHFPHFLHPRQIYARCKKCGK